MPLITPRAGDDENKFISRCMSDSKMRAEFPTPEQRYSVCIQNWKNRQV